jgi:two-component system, NarL family, invasion response regulator UvrY
METLLVADDHEIVRQGIRLIVESFPKKYQFFEASTCVEVMKTLSREKIDFAILDMQLEDGNIFSTVSQFTDYCSKTAVLVYTTSPEKIYARRLVQKGIKGFLSKQSPIAQLETAIRTVLNGEVYLSPWMKETIFQASKANDSGNPIDTLSDRELEVAEYVSSGIGMKEIAELMNVDITTASTYRRRAFDKLNVQNVVELVNKMMLYKMQG